ncbi:SDR family oxidoreductase [Flavobacterium sp. J27]|uniref:SDR family oxidoreductase n=1 Tax=Flavobacterium sp. J27 TaxID=2060419 RepID=UPI00102F9C29|nr:SDR family oxidoreductase [Flavobacterium sp. J27]
MNAKKVWFVTGASKGLGLALVKKLLENDYYVAATSRDKLALEKAVNYLGNNFLPLEVDLINEESVTNGLAAAVEKFGKIDMVVNNAGYGQAGTLEELSDEESRENFDVNVFGVLHVIRKVMPYLRENKAGHIINISSVGGFMGNFPSFGVYCATKYALVGLTEALAAEVGSLGIHATVVYPGYFRTNFLDNGSFKLPKNPIAVYTEARKLEEMHVNEIRGNQTGNPDKAADVFIAISKQEKPPLHLFLGSDSYQFAKQKIEIVTKELNANEKLATSTDY